MAGCGRIDLPCGVDSLDAEAMPALAEAGCAVRAGARRKIQAIHLAQEGAAGLAGAETKGSWRWPVSGSGAARW